MNKLNKSISTLLLLLSSTSSFSNETEKDTPSIYLGGFSKHITKDTLNEKHDLIGIKYRNIFISHYKNSYEDNTIMLGYDFRFKAEDTFTHSYAKYFEYGIVTGFSYGYKCEDIIIPCYEKFSPAIIPYIEFTKYNIKPVIAMLGEAVFITFKIDL